MLPTRPIEPPPDAGAVTLPARTLGKDDFLRLLLVQLRHQNPLEPLDQAAFLSQTAQFTTVEELQNIGRALDDLREAGTAGTLAQAAGLLGRTVALAGRSVTLDGTGPVGLPVTLDAPAAGLTVEVLDAEGRRVRELAVGARSAGTHTVTWDGRDAGGRALPAGTYFYRVTAAGATAVAATGVVTGVQAAGSRILYRVDGALVRPEDIVDVRP
jgi:flagellar basal-body rod modification protein FlgD